MQVDGLTDLTEIRAGFGVRIDGIDRTGAFGPGWSVTHDADAAFASASLPVVQPFTLSQGRHTIAVYAGWQGDTSQPVFVGEVTNAAETYYPHASTLTAGGYLKRTDVGLDVQMGFYATGGTAEAAIPAGYDHVPIATDADLIIHILETYGITPATTGHHIEASDWVPARITPILWDIGRSGWSIIQELDAIADYATSDGRLGQVLRRQVFGMVPAGTRHTFQQGVDILDLRLSTAYEVYNQVKVTGASDPADVDNKEIVGIAPAGAPYPSYYIPDPPGVRTDDSLSSMYIETLADATSIAERRLARLYQPLQEITLTTFGCADLDIDDGVGIDADVLGINTTAFVVTHTIAGSPFQSVLTLRGSPSADSRGNEAPTPQMLISIILEHVVIAGAVTALAMITVDARASTDSDGTIASWEIDLDGATYTGSDITTALITHATTSISPIAVTLTVTDDDALSATLPMQATWDPATALIEPLTVAEVDQGEASSDGELTWQAFTAPVTAIAPIALGGTTLWGCSDGKVYRSTDMLATAPTLAHTFPAAVNCLWCNESVPARWLAGLTNGDLWLSIDDGLTWVKLWTFADPVNDVGESPAAPGQITVCSGPYLWHTFSTGMSWETLVNWTGHTALRFAAAPFDGVAQAWVGYDDGTIISTAGPELHLPVAAAIRGLTISLDATELYILTDSLLTYSYTTPGGLVTGPSTSTATNRAIRSGSGKWIYAATDGAVQKVLPHDRTYDVRLMIPPSRALAVGYGSVRVPPPPPPPPVGPLEVYLPTTSSSTLGGVWHYVPGSGWSRLTGGLPLGIVWRWIAASPLDPNVLAMVGQGIPPGYPDQYANDLTNHKVIMNVAGTPRSPVWVSADAGATWSEAECRAPVEASGDSFGFFQIEFSRTTPGRWYVVGRTTTGGGTRVTRWSGDMTTPRTPWIDVDFNHDFEWLHAGDDEDTLTSYHDGANQIVYVPTPPVAHATGILETIDERLIPRPPGPDKPNMDTLFGTRSLFALEGQRSNGNRLWFVSDYRTNTIYLTEQIFPVSSGDQAGYVTATVDAAYISQGDGTYEVKVIPPPPAPYSWHVNSTKTYVAEKVQQIRSDRQSQRVVAGRSSGDQSKIILYDGTVWSRLDGPPESNSNIAGCIEVVTREGTP